MKKLTAALAVAAATLSLGIGHAAPYPSDYAIVGTAPIASAYSPATHLFYVANAATHDVSVLAGAAAHNTHSPLSPRAGAFAEVARIALPVNAAPVELGLAVHAKTGVVYVSNQTDDTIVQIVGGSSTAVSALPAGHRPWGLAVESDLNRLCVANFSDNTVDVFDTTNRTRVATIPVPAGPYGMAAGNGFCYVTSWYAGTVSKIDLRAGFGAVVPSGLTNTAGVVASFPEGISLTPDGLALYVANSARGSVSKINPVNLGVLQEIMLPAGSVPVAVAVSTAVVWVTESGRDRVATISTVTGGVAELISGQRPMGIAVGGTPECAVAANFGNETAGLYCDLDL